jgi:hypothetical protein
MTCMAYASDGIQAVGAVIAPVPLWRVSHAYDPEAAVRLICWFSPDTGTVVVTLFAVDKARLGDVFYDGVAARADPLIDQRKRETANEEEG